MEKVHEVGQYVGMRGVVKLLYVDDAILQLDECGLVVIEIAIIRRTKHRNHSRQLLLSLPTIKPKPLQLRLVPPDNTNHLRPVHKVSTQLISEVIRAPSNLIERDHLVGFSLWMIDRISP